MKICEKCFNEGKTPKNFKEDTWNSCGVPVHNTEIMFDNWKVSSKE